MLDQDPSLPTALIDFPAAGVPAGPDAPRQRWRFKRPLQWLVAHDASQVPALLDATHALAKEGKWCLGWVAYEAAPGFNPHLPVKALPPGQPYAVWAVFDAAQPWTDETAVDDGGTWRVGPWQADMDAAGMQANVSRIHELIRAGEVYQINLTTQLHADYQGAPATLRPYFDALRRSQPHGYAFMLDARAACRAPGAVLSVSPELFFDWDGHTLTTRPMKGTAARGLDAATDHAAAVHLRASPKERAENLMIVDLLRNDLSMIAEVGSVDVPSLFDVQALPTVWQMTSTIVARSRAGLRLSEVFGALFPCGSVTGAPKRQAMHHIARIERSARSLYCGAAGIMAPGGRVTFNVPIRTVTLDTPPAPAPWRAHCGIGSGITLDATPEGEAAEWQAKQGFLKRSDRPFELLESMRLEDGVIAWREAHLARLAGSARHFGFRWDAEVAVKIDGALDQAARSNASGVHKIRLLLAPHGMPVIQSTPLDGPGLVMQMGPHRNGAGLAEASTTPGNGPSLAHQPAVVLATRPMPPADDFIRHKTTRRDAYAAFQPPADAFDTLLYNEQGELTESTIGNVALRIEGQWCTPPQACGLLPGVMRAWLLQQGLVLERPLLLNDLARAQAIAVFNSVRGWVPVRLKP